MGKKYKNILYNTWDSLVDAIIQNGSFILIIILWTSLWTGRISWTSESIFFSMWKWIYTSALYVPRGSTVKPNWAKRFTLIICGHLSYTEFSKIKICWRFLMFSRYNVKSLLIQISSTWMVDSDQLCVANGQWTLCV